MACFLVPTAEAIVTGVVSKVEKKNEVAVEGKIPFSRKLKWLKNMLWGGAALLAFDFMHLTQTRIATIDSFATLFILLMYLFLYRYFTEGRLRHLAACGVTFGIGAATKWTCLYAGAASACSGRCTGCFRACRRTGTVTVAGISAACSATSASASCFSCSCRA